MITRRRLDSRYSRILGIGLGVSLAAHAAVLAFGRLHVDAVEPANTPLREVTLSDLEVAPEEWERLELSSTITSSAVSAVPPVEELGSVPSDLETPEFVPAAEYEVVLAMATAADLASPTLPRPRAEAATVESGLTPIHVLEPIALGSADSGARGGGGVYVSLGGGGCAVPGFVNSVYPTQRGNFNRLRFRSVR